ncbi:MAG TPA: DUF5777 family beta-barrel protein [Bacteroidia bacterium]|nr:DUF5777 family beta-barrel protein [Bacteroidia bacterium]
MKKILFFLFLFTAPAAFAQIDLDSMANSMANSAPPAREFVRATFKTTRIINFPNTENVGKHILDFRISHRFGDLNSGAYNAFGLDGPACIRIAFDYGITNYLQVGIARTSIDKLIEGSAKWRILRQTTDNKMPVSLTWYATMNYTAMKDPNAAITGYDKYNHLVDRFSYAHCLMLGRKFSDKFSIELNGFFIHYNIVDNILDKNDIFAVGFSGRYKLTSRTAITWEYAYRINKYNSNPAISYYDPIGVGFDIETGGHVFQVHITNAFGMNEVQYIPFSTSNPFKGGLRVGFNISRVFTTGKKDPNNTW